MTAMKPEIQLTHRFVDLIPEELEEGVVYVCLQYGTVVHKCCSGCGREVVTPLSPMDWTVSSDGRTISLYPSIGNWSSPCRSHYWIRNNKAVWAPQWSESQIERGRSYDRAAKQAYFESTHDITRTTKSAPRRRNIWSRIKGWFS
jgi:hypothetical protein